MTLLMIENLWIRLAEGRAARPIIAGTSLHVERGEVVGLVGESGSGKSVTCRAVLGQLPEDSQTSGSIEVEGDEVIGMDRAGLRRLRSHQAAMVFQDPRASIDPLRRVGRFLTDPLRTNLGYSRQRAEERAIELLTEVGIANPRKALRRWPHEFSGGMLQRVVIAAALAGDPKLLLADEATTALDVTTQAEVVALLQRIAADRQMGILFVTHDLELAAAICDRVYVMYAGEVVESQAVDELFDRPLHPYTQALLAATPRLDGDPAPPASIPGRPLGLSESTPGCPFAPRCTHAMPECDDSYPTPDGSEVLTACIRVEQIHRPGATTVGSRR